MIQSGRTSDHRGASPPPPPEPPNLWLLHFDPAADPQELLKAYRDDPNVLYAEPNYEGSLCFVPSDPLFGQTRASLDPLGLEAAWDTQPGGEGVTVAVIDSGIDPTHPELNAAVDLAQSYNFVDHNTSVFDDIGHGTRVAGIIGAAAGNGEGIAGVAYGCRLLALDVADARGVISVADVAEAIGWAAAHGAKVINLSLCFNAPSQALEDACRAAADSGALLVAAAGNENQGERPVWPASLAPVLGVGAVMNDTLARAPWSNYNKLSATKLVDLVAPGVMIFSTVPGGQYNGSYGSGTSFAAPLVAGTAALLAARYPGQSGAALRRHLLATAKPLAAFEPAGGAGSGLVSAQQALLTPLLPELSIGSVTVDDAKDYSAANNADGNLDQGETVRLSVTLKNAGADLAGADVTLATEDKLVSLASAVTTFGALGCGREASPAGPAFTLTLAPNAPAHQIALTLAVTARPVSGPAIQQTLTFSLGAENTMAVGAASYFTPQTWTAGNTYEVRGTQNFNAGLTLEPGTVVKMAPGADLSVNGGVLTANGTADQPILLTALPAAAGSSRKQGPLGPVGPQNEPLDLTPYQQVRYVSAASGSDETGDGSPTRPWATISNALLEIDWLQPGPDGRCALLVAEGSYGGETLQMRPDVDLYGGFESAGWSRDIFKHATVLDGEGQRRVVDAADRSRLDGFTITGGAWAGLGYDPYGAGIAWETGAPVIRNNTITGNALEAGFAGAIYCGEARDADSSAQITNNLISGNSSAYAAGIFCQERARVRIGGNLICGNFTAAGATVHCEPYAVAVIDGNVVTDNAGGGIQSENSVVSNNVIAANTGSQGGGIDCGLSTITNNIIAGNAASSDGGGGYCYLSTLQNNLVTHNTAGRLGGGLWVSGSTLVGNTVVENSAPSGSGLYLEPDSSPASTIKNSIVQGNKGSADVFGGQGELSYCLVGKGFAGAGNLDVDPRFAGPAAMGGASAVTYDSATLKSVLTCEGSALVSGALAGRVLNFGAKAFLVAANTETEITVWGNAERGAQKPWLWEAPDYHLSPVSPCVDAGNNTGAPATDLEGTPRPLKGRSSLTADMGAYECDPAQSGNAGWWGRLYLQGDAGSSMRYCTVERGGGVLSQSADVTFAFCTFRDNTGRGLEATAGSGTISSSTAANNAGGGIWAPNFDLTACAAQGNKGVGLKGSALTTCFAADNTSTGLAGASATDCRAVGNGGPGLHFTQTLLRCTAEGNRAFGIKGQASQCVSLNNDGVGFFGSAEACEASGNGNGGVYGNASGCRIHNNTGIPAPVSAARPARPAARSSATAGRRSPAPKPSAAARSPATARASNGRPPSRGATSPPIRPAASWGEPSPIRPSSATAAGASPASVDWITAGSCSTGAPGSTPPPEMSSTPRSATTAAAACATWPPATSFTIATSPAMPPTTPPTTRTTRPAASGAASKTSALTTGARTRPASWPPIPSRRATSAASTTCSTAAWRAAGISTTAMLASSRSRRW